MQHGDIQVRISLFGEPQKLLTYWRGSLRDVVPQSASVTILKIRRRSRLNWWARNDDPNFYFEAMNRSENKRAELSISDKALYMTAPEIATARELTALLFDWLRRRHSIPDVAQPITNARISLSITGGLELIDFIEKLGDPEVLSVASVGAVYVQGEPRHADLRWLPDMKGVDKRVTLGELPYFEKALAEGQAEAVRAVVDRIARVFRRSLNKRRAYLNKRFTEVFGYGEELEINGRPITDEMIEGYQYDDLLRFLAEEDRKQKPKDNIRAWREGS